VKRFLTEKNVFLDDLKSYYTLYGLNHPVEIHIIEERHAVKKNPFNYKNAKW